MTFNSSPNDELIKLINQAIEDPSEDFNLLNFRIDQNWLDKNADFALKSQMKSHWNENQNSYNPKIRMIIAEHLSNNYDFLQISKIEGDNIRFVIFVIAEGVFNKIYDEWQKLAFENK